MIERKINPSTTLLYIAYAMIVIYYFGNKVIPFMGIREIIFKIIPFLLLFVVIIQSKKYNAKSIFGIMLVIVAGFISYHQSNNISLLLTILFIIASKNIKIDKFIKYDLILKTIILISIIVLYKFGLTELVLKYRIDGTLRSTLGFGHPNVLGAILLNISLDIAFLKYKKMTISNYVFIIILLLLAMYVCDSRGSQICIILTLILSIVFPKIENKSITKLIPILPFLFLIISLSLAWMYKNNYQFAIQIDNLTSTRIQCTTNFLEYYGINMFGNYFQYYGRWDLSRTLYALDNAYINILVQYGTIITLIVLVSIYKCLKKSGKEKQFHILLFFLIMLFYATMENYAYMIAYNPILIYLSNILFYKKEGEQNEENCNNNISFCI